MYPGQNKGSGSESNEGEVGFMYSMQLSTAEQELLFTMVSKELEETRVECHHTKNNDYKEYLRNRESILKDMLQKMM